ncbi:MAG: hypothetical protein QOF03_1423 [Alphaproteobacteria bacterium]|jgi:uncharacterized membrane protein YidH (DUF202 family)|nr:hypothetical protein [Alphaproteobacteria bacterium]
MRPRDVFGVIVRTVGLVVILYAIILILMAIARFSGLTVATQQTAVVDALFGAIYLFLGCGLIFGAESIVRAAYGTE